MVKINGEEKEIAGKNLLEYLKEASDPGFLSQQAYSARCTSNLHTLYLRLHSGSAAA